MNTMLSRLPLIGHLFAPDPALVARLRTVIASRRETNLDTAEAHDAWVAGLAQELRISVDDVDFLVSAIGSYQLRATVMRGVAVSYDRHHQQVFRALDQLVAEGHGP